MPDFMAPGPCRNTACRTDGRREKFDGEMVPERVSPRRPPEMTAGIAESGRTAATVKVCGTADRRGVDALPGFGNRFRRCRPEQQKKHCQNRPGKQQKTVPPFFSGGSGPIFQQCLHFHKNRSGKIFSEQYSGIYHRIRAVSNEKNAAEVRKRCRHFPDSRRLICFFGSG